MATTPLILLATDGEQASIWLKLAKRNIVLYQTSQDVPYESSVKQSRCILKYRYGRT